MLDLQVLGLSFYKGVITGFNIHALVTQVQVWLVVCASTEESISRKPLTVNQYFELETNIKFWMETFCA